MYELTAEAQFDSAHNLRKYDGPCESLHGHTYRVQVSYAGTTLADDGILIDFKDLRSALDEVVSYLDHRYINELPEFHDVNPTAECLARFIFERMRGLLGSSVSRVTVWETPTSSASYFEPPDDQTQE